MKDLSKQLEKELKKEIKKTERTFTAEFNRWINQLAEKHNLSSDLIDLSQENQKRFAEVFYKGKIVAYVTIEHNRLKFHDLM
ncbi:MAG: hypothetical protein WDZ80_04205 [Candidatus Paceibacterota bacterium]